MSSAVCPVALFDNFVSASTFKNILHSFNQICQVTGLDPLEHQTFYQKLKINLSPWKAQKLWGLLDKRYGLKEYRKQKACQNLRVLVIGGGPCGLRMAIECALLGCKVVVVEKRDRFSRNNVLHLWPFVIQDLKDLGAKLFYPKFCAGSIDHISIRQLQCILLKVALVFGVQIESNISFESVISPYEQEIEGTGWLAKFSPPNHYLHNYEFDILIGADGKRNTVPGFPRREMRGKLAIGITANFVNNRTLEEERVQEISGVAFVFNQQFFKDMRTATNIDLENIVYYKDATHYFVMCAKKQSLLQRGVIIQDFDEVNRLLSPKNVDESCLLQYAKDAADFATKGGLSKLEFAQNHLGKPDVAMFDFTSLFSAENSSRIVEHSGRRLVLAIVGDSLHEPFWPTGSGVARGFLSCFDVAWMMKNYCTGNMTPLQVIADRESVYRLLAQTTPDNLARHHQKYTIDPKTRYLSIENALLPVNVNGLFDTDRPDLIDKIEFEARYKGRSRNEANFIKHLKLIKQIQQALYVYKLRVENMSYCWSNGVLLCALVSRFRPDLIDMSTIKPDEPESNLRTIFGIVQNEFGIDPPIFCTSLDEINFDSWVPDSEKMYEYLFNIWQQVRARFAKQIENMNPKESKSTSLKRQHERTRKEEYRQKVHRFAPQPIELPTRPFNQSESKENIGQKIEQFEKNEHLDFESELNLLDDEFDDEEIEEMLRGWEEEEKIIGEEVRHSDRLQRLVSGYYSRVDVNNSTNMKYRTKKPGMVEKLNPARLKTVETMLLGDLPLKIKEMRDRKQRQAIKTRKLDKDEIKEMEDKLEQTGIGSLLYKKVEPALSPMERKIIEVKTADLKQKSLNGFAENDKFEKFDEKLKALDCKLRTPNISGNFGVSQLKQHHELTPNSFVRKSSTPSLHEGSLPPSPKGPPPPVPQKRISSPLKPFVPQTSAPVLPPAKKDPCHICEGRVYLAERVVVDGLYLHKRCFKCAFCNKLMRMGEGALDRSLECSVYRNRFFCKMHLNLSLAEKIAKVVKSPPKEKESGFVQVSTNFTETQQLPVFKPIESKFSKPLSQATSLLMHGMAVPIVHEKPRKPVLDPVKVEVPDETHSAIFKTPPALSKTPSDLFETPSAFSKTPNEALKTPVSAIAFTAPITNTPERVEFECSFIDERLFENENSEEDIESGSDEEVLGEDIGDKDRSTDSGKVSDSESEDGRSLSGSELEELEMTLNEASAKNMNNTISDIDARSIAQRLRVKNRNKVEQSNSEVSSDSECSENDDTTVDKSNSSFLEAIAQPFRGSIKYLSNYFKRGSTPTTPPCKEIDESMYFTPAAGRTNDIPFADTSPLEGVFKTPAAPPNKRGASEGDNVFLPNASPMRERKWNELEKLRAEAKEKAMKKSDADYGIHSKLGERRSEPGQDTLSPTSASTSVDCGSRCVSTPPQVESTPKYKKRHSFFGISKFLGKGEKIQDLVLIPPTSIDSQKETSLLDKIKKKKGKKKGSPIVQKNVDEPEVKDNGTVHDTVDAVKSIPIGPGPSMASAESLDSISDREIRRVQRAAEKLMRQQEQQKGYEAQSLNRKHQELQVRREEIEEVGNEFEKKLADSPEDRSILECWLSLVNERHALERCEQDIELRIRELELEARHSQLQNTLRESMTVAEHDKDSAHRQKETSVLEEMLLVVAERDALVTQLERERRAENDMQTSIQSMMHKKGFTYRNFDPVFSSSNQDMHKLHEF